MQLSGRRGMLCSYEFLGDSKIWLSSDSWLPAPIGLSLANVISKCTYDCLVGLRALEATKGQFGRL